MLPVLVLQQVGLIGRGRRAKGLDDLEATTTFVHHVDADATRAADLPAYEHATKKNAKDTFPYKSFRPGNRPAEGLLQGEWQGCDNGGGVTVQLEGVCALLAHECRERFVKGCQVVG